MKRMPNGVADELGGICNLFYESKYPSHPEENQHERKLHVKNKGVRVEISCKSRDVLFNFSEKIEGVHAILPPKEGGYFYNIQIKPRLFAEKVLPGIHCGDVSEGVTNYLNSMKEKDVCGQTLMGERESKEEESSDEESETKGCSLQ